MTASYLTAERATPTAEFVTGLITDEQAFAGLGPAWSRLHQRCGAATPFQSHAWLHSWWLSYGRRGALRLVVVRNGGELVALAPLMRVRHPLPALVPLGGAISDYGDVLIDDAHTDRAANALTTGLAAAARTALIDFREVRPGGAAEHIWDRWRGPRHRMPDSLCLELPAVPMGELIARLPSAKAQRVRAKLRKLAALGVRRRVVPPHEVDLALRRLLELHQLQWQGRKVTPEHLRERFRAHLVRAVGPMVRSGNAVVTEFRLGTEVVAVDLTLLSRRLAGCYLYGAHPGLRERKADVAVMLLDACAESAGGGSVPGPGLGPDPGPGPGPGPRRDFSPDLGPGTLSLLRGDEPYKHHWHPEPVVSQRLLLARRRTAPLLSAVVCDAAARQRGKEVLRGWRERGGDGDGGRGGNGNAT